MSDEYYIHEDDWGLVSLLPQENFEHARAVFLAAAEHHKDTEFGEFGWSTPPFQIPKPSVSIVERRMPLEELAGLLSPVLPPAASVSTLGRSYECFAFGATYRLSLYGRQQEGLVTALHLLDRSPEGTDLEALGEALVRLGTRYGLILVDWQQDAIINLADAEEVGAYLRWIANPDPESD